MQPLIINATESSPEIICNPEENVFEISGDSRPENANEFYTPLLKWLDAYKVEIQYNHSPKPCVFKFDFEYLNSISIKYAFELLKRIEALKAAGLNVEIHWYYAKRDEDIRENGNEFATLVSVPLKVIQKD